MFECTIRLRNDLAELSRLAEALEILGERAKLPASAVFALNLALDELFTNVVLYGYSDAAAHEIEIHLKAMAGIARAELRDDGRPFNPLDAPPPPLHADVAKRPIGGLGVHLTRRLMDEVRYRYEDGRNHLSLIKRY